MKTIKELVKDNIVYFDYYRKGYFYYVLWDEYDDHEKKEYIQDKYMFPVPLEDLGDATLLNEDKAIMFMTYIKQAIKDGTFIEQ